MKHNLAVLVLALLWGAFFGCTKQGSPATGKSIVAPSAPASDEISVVESTAIEVLSTAIVAGEKFTVKGSFRLTGVPEGPPSLTVVKIIKPDTSGKSIIQREGGVTPVRDGDAYTFRGDIEAPKHSGNYRLEAWYKQRKVGEGHVDVTEK